MACYRPAGQDFYFACPVPELAPFEISGSQPATEAPPVAPAVLLSRTVGWVGGEQREVESWFAPPGTLLKVAGGSSFYIAPSGRAIVRVEGTKETAPGDSGLPAQLTALDREILVGPALVLALALRGVWCLHASAVIWRGHSIAFLGESGQGKSTLAACLADAGRPDWRLVADDILPVTDSKAGVDSWPHFPQLKLSMQAQPGPGLPEHIPLDRICVLAHAGKDENPDLLSLASGQAVEMLLRHTAGTRLFDPALLGNHLAFCGRVARQIPFYRLVYPHRKEALAKVQELLESLC